MEGETQKLFSHRPISKNDSSPSSLTIDERSKFDFDNELFSRARKRRESAAIFNRLNEG